MPNPPHDSLSDYLEAHSLLETLHNRKGRLLGEPGATPASGADSEPLLTLVDAGIRKAGALVVQYEQEIEGSLQELADQADSARELFFDVSKRIREFHALLGEYSGALTSEERTRWEGVLEDYSSLHSEWAQKLPPEDCPPPLE
jgi:hypothetical protein